MRAHTLDAVDRIIRAEAQASGSPKEPDVAWGERYPVTVNDPETTERVDAAFVAEFGEQALLAPGAISGSEDVGVLATAAGVPLIYWMLGGGVADRAVADPVRLLGRLLYDLGIAARGRSKVPVEVGGGRTIVPYLPLAIISVMVRRSSSVTPAPTAGGCRTIDVSGWLTGPTVIQRSPL